MIKTIFGNEITINHISQALELDRISYDDIYQLQLESCIGFYKSNPEIYIMAVDTQTNMVVGYINFSPIGDKLYSLLSTGQAIDTVIKPTDIIPYKKGVDCWGYFSSIVVHPNYRLKGIATQMLMVWKDFVFNLAKERNIIFKGIVADAVSNSGEKILSSIGFVCARTSTHKSKIMILNLFSKDIMPNKYNDIILDEYRSKED